MRNYGARFDRSQKVRPTAWSVQPIRKRGKPCDERQLPSLRTQSDEIYDTFKVLLVRRAFVRRRGLYSGVGLFACAARRAIGFGTEDGSIAGWANRDAI